MPLSIKNDQTEKLAREVAQEAGESLTLAIQRALQERLERLRFRRRNRLLENQIDEILARVDQLPILDARTPDEILNYDENGLPR